MEEFIVFKVWEEEESYSMGEGGEGKNDFRVCLLSFIWRVVEGMASVKMCCGGLNEMEFVNGICCCCWAIITCFFTLFSFQYKNYKNQSRSLLVEY